MPPVSPRLVGFTQFSRKKFNIPLLYEIQYTFSGYLLGSHRKNSSLLLHTVVMDLKFRRKYALPQFGSGKSAANPPIRGPNLSITDRNVSSLPITTTESAAHKPIFFIFPHISSIFFVVSVLVHMFGYTRAHIMPEKSAKRFFVGHCIVCKIVLAARTLGQQVRADPACAHDFSKQVLMQESWVSYEQTRN